MHNSFVALAHRKFCREVVNLHQFLSGDTKNSTPYIYYAEKKKQTVWTQSEKQILIYSDNKTLWIYSENKTLCIYSENKTLWNQSEIPGI